MLVVLVLHETELGGQTLVACDDVDPCGACAARFLEVTCESAILALKKGISDSYQDSTIYII